MKYSELERVGSLDELKHPIIREAFKLVGLEVHSLEITSMADIPAGTGLGSSGSFTTALVTWTARLLPLLPFTRALLFDLKVPPSPGTLWALARLNVVYHVVYSLYRYPRYGRLVQRVGARLERAAAGAWRVLRGRRPRLT